MFLFESSEAGQRASGSTCVCVGVSVCLVRFDSETRRVTRSIRTLYRPQPHSASSHPQSSATIVIASPPSLNIPIPFASTPFLHSIRSCPRHRADGDTANGSAEGFGTTGFAWGWWGSRRGVWGSAPDSRVGERAVIEPGDRRGVIWGREDGGDDNEGVPGDENGSADASERP